MKNKILSLALCAAGAMGLAACSDYFDTKSYSEANAEFVFSNMTTARAAMDGAYAEWHGAVSSHVYGDGLFYALDIAGSDIMRHPEKYSAQPARHIPEAFYINGTEAGSYDPVTYGKEAPNSPYSVLFSVVGKANAITSAIEEMSGYDEMLLVDEPSDLSQLYGEAVALRATAYRELIKYYGDVPFQTKMGQAATGLSPRDSIYDILIGQLILVEPLMRPVAANNKNYFSQTYVDALIGRLALEAGGYQTRRGDITYVDGAGEALTFETKGSQNNGATYGRRNDWRELYAVAKQYFQLAIDHKGAAKLSPNYSDLFVQLHGDDASFADETIYEEPFQQGAAGNDPRPYSLGRASTGAGSNDYPCKNYGQGRINPAFYYGVFDPKDLRRDLAASVTGGNKGYEKLIPFTPGSQANGGGITCNKFDENRQATVWTKNQRRSGINAPYMRMSEVYLGLAEAAAALGDDVTAKQNLKLIRDRAFGGNGNVDAFIAKEGSVLKAVIDERGFEFAGEGDRRFTLIRTGLIGEKIDEIKALTTKMMDGLAANGYYEFENGNVISNYIYTKMVDAKTHYGKRLTEATPAGKENDPVLAPGWRGVNNDWESYGLDYKKNFNTNVAIQGLFTRLSAAEEAALVADGYTKVDWGKQLLDNRQEYETYLFYQFDSSKAPIYLFPFSPNTMATGGFTNGYGFVND
ncbi:MAG: RagB/SusD family nutrient uptake outer membrane protein [Prevotella sp.]|nr:RagB/SusD family nutrient uptake outer membrane protein [Prevotella sp.]